MVTVKGGDVRKVVVACDAGMGSSVLLTSQLKKELSSYSVAVSHSSVNSIPGDADVVVCHAGLADRARSIAPGAAVLAFQLFIGDPVFKQLVTAIKEGSDIAG